MGLTRIRAEQISDIDYKQAVRAVTTTNITLAGGTPALVDGVSVVIDDRILVTGQDAGAENGLYKVQTVGTGSSGTWIRTTDGNETGEIDAGMIVMVTEGTIYRDTQWKLVTDNPITIGSTVLTFTQNYSANSISSGTSNVVVNSNSSVTISSAGTANVAQFDSTTVTIAANILPSSNVTYSLGNNTQRWSNLWLSNSTIYLGAVNVSANDAALTVNGANVLTGNTGAPFSTTGNITGGNLLTTGVVTATGNVTGSYFFGNGSQLSGIITTVDASTLSGTTLSSNVVTSSLTSVGTLGSLAVTGNITSGNVSGTTGTFTNISGTLTTAAQTNITSLGTLTGLTVNGTITQTGNLNITGNINATGNLNYDNVTDLVVGDPLIYLGANNTGNLYDLGFVASFNDGTYQHSGFVRNHTDGVWGVFGNVSAEPTTTVDWANAVYQPFRSGAATFIGANINGALSGATTINASGNANVGNIGATTGVFTNISGTLTTAAQTNITSVGTLSSLTVTGNVTGGNLTTVGVVTATGNVSGSYFIGNGSQLTGISASGGVKWTTVANTAPSTPNAGDFWFNSYTGIKYQYTNDGTSNTWVDQSFPTSFSTISVGNISNNNSNGVGNIGSSVTYFNTIFAKATSAQYADLAEMYEADALYAPGYVVVFGGEKEITLSRTSHDTAVAGIVSTNPSYLMNSGQTGECVLPVALTGRVPCFVQGPVNKGDVLVTSDKPGIAQRISATYQPGCVIGKSLAVIVDSNVEIIEVAVGRF